MYVLKPGGTKERGIYSFDDPIIYITPAHVIGEMNLKMACVKTVPLGRRRNRSSRRAELRRLQEGYHWTGGLPVTPNHQQGGSRRDTSRCFPTALGERCPVGVVGKGAVGGHSSGWQLQGTGSLEGLHALFEGDPAQVTRAVESFKAEAAKAKRTTQSAQVPMPPLSWTTPSALPLALPPQPATGAPAHNKSLSQPNRKSPSAGYPWPLPSRIDQVAEVLSDRP